jgi:hypothetical protein
MRRRALALPVVGGSGHYPFPECSLKLDGRETDFVFGLGVEGKISETMSARVDFLSSADVDADVVRAALNFKFGGYRRDIGHE